MRKKQVLSDQGFIKGFFLLFVFIALCFIGISFGKPYYRYNSLRSHTKDFLLMDIGDANAIKTRVLADAKELNIPLDEEHLEVAINPTSKLVKVKATWSETVNFWDYYSKKFDFELQVEN